MKKHTLVLVLSLALVFGIAVGGTLAYLKATTADVVNTFTVGDINIDLEEHPLKTGDAYDGKTIDKTATTVKAESNYKMIPGNTLQKDPFVTVKKDSEACWLFVKITKSENFDTYMTFEVADGWTALGASYPGVYYREVPAATANVTFSVLKNDQVVVKSDVTKAQLEAAKTNKPTLTLTAYAVQKDNVATAAAAWEIANAA